MVHSRTLHTVYSTLALKHTYLFQVRLLERRQRDPPGRQQRRHRQLVQREQAGQRRRKRAEDTPTASEEDIAYVADQGVAPTARHAGLGGGDAVDAVAAPEPAVPVQPEPVQEAAAEPAHRGDVDRGGSGPDEGEDEPDVAGEQTGFAVEERQDTQV